MPKNDYLECGLIVATHGVKGTMRVQSYCDSPDVLAKLKTVYMLKNKTYQPFKVLHASLQKGMVLLSLEGIATLEEANLLRNTTLYALRQDLPLKKGAYFLADLFELPVLDQESGEKLGTLTDILNPAGQQIYEVTKADGTTFLIPAVKELIRKIEIDGESCGIYVHLIDGMME